MYGWQARHIKFRLNNVLVQMTSPKLNVWKFSPSEGIFRFSQFGVLWWWILTEPIVILIYICMSEPPAICLEIIQTYTVIYVSYLSIKLEVGRVKIIFTDPQPSPQLLLSPLISCLFSPSLLPCSHSFTLSIDKVEIWPLENLPLAFGRIPS